jgi:hypothetical protein
MKDCIVFIEILCNKYPNGYITKEEFFKAYQDDPMQSEGDDRSNDFLKLLFDSIDRDHSGGC